VFFSVLIGVASVVVLLQGSAKYVWVVPIALASAGFAGKAGWRMPRASMTITSDEVIVAGPLKTWWVPLVEATSFVASGAGRQPTIFLKQRSGWPIAIWALNRNGFVWNLKGIVANLEPVARHLDTVLERAKAGE
jgi:hypothetical protein